MFSKRRERSLPWLVVSLLAACAGANDGTADDATASAPEQSGMAGAAAEATFVPGSAPSFDSALPAERPVNALASAEWNTLCGEIGTWTHDVFAAVPESTCLLGGLVLGANPQSCETMVDSCLAEADSPPPPACDAGLEADCTATVGELSTCLNQVSSVIDSIEPGVSCAATLDTAMLGTVLRPLTGATACLSLQITCPALSAAVMPGM